MKARRLTSPELVLAAVSVVLLLLPSRLTHPPRLTMLSGFSPFRISASSARHGVEHARDLVRPDSAEELRRRLEFLESENFRLHAKNAEMRARIEALSAARQAAPEPEFALLNADVTLTADTSVWRRSIVVSLGSDDGVVKGLPVVWHDALVGLVEWVGRGESRVLLTTDPSFVAGAVTVPRSDPEGTSLDSRSFGLLRGDTDLCRLDWITGDRPVESGTPVVTTADPRRHLPKGLLLGQVSSVSRTRGPYARIGIEPAVNPHALEFVTILKPR